jgi:glucosamine-phosphate N-acetyltransferase
VGHIQDVVVDIAHRGEQLGSALLDSLIDYARDKQCYKIVLEAKEEIMPFYQKNGFSKSGASLSLYF